MGGEEGIKRGRYSTDELPPGERHDSWSEREWPSVAALFRSTPIGEFSTAAEDFALDGIALSYTTGTARLLERTPERIAADRIDILGVGVLLEGEMEGTAATREFQLGGGEMLLLDFSQPVTMTMSVSWSIQMAIPRPLAAARLGPVDGLHGNVIPVAQAAAFRAFLLELHGRLQSDDALDGAALAEALIASLARTIRGG